MNIHMRHFLVTFVVIVVKCHELAFASPADPHIVLTSQERFTDDDRDGKLKPESSGIKLETSGYKENTREFAQIMKILEEMENERAHSKRTFHIPGGRTESLVEQNRAHFINLAKLYLPSPETANPACQRDLLAIFLALLDIKNPDNMWALNLVDSWGKLPDGIIVGNMKALGFFYECLNINVKQHYSTSIQLETTSNLPPHHSDGSRHNLPHAERYVYDHQDGTQKGSNFHNPLMFADEWRMSNPVIVLEDSSDFEAWDSSNFTVEFEGQYCLLSYTLNDTNATIGFGDWLKMPGISVSLPIDKELLSLMAYGTCIPSSCTWSDLQESVDVALLDEGLKLMNVYCQTSSTHPTMQAPEIVGITLISLLCFVLLLASLADIATSTQRWEHYKTGVLKYLLTFSVPTNITRLFHLDIEPKPTDIPCMHGIRFLSILWVVLGHQYAYTISLAQNPKEIPKMMEAVLFQLISNADKSVDTFFLMSGLLVSVGLLGQVTHEGRFKVLRYYIHRIIRLVPPIAMTVALVACLSGLVVSGPMAPGFEPSFLRWCRHNWWMDVTMLTNLFLPHMAQLGHSYGITTCIPHSWYVCVDMQIYLIMPLVLLPLYYKPKLGRVWLGAVTVASLAIPAIIIGVNDLWPTSMTTADQSGSLEYDFKVYLMPWTRASPYLVGAWVGYIIFLARSNPSITRLSAWQVWAGWGISTGTALAVLLGITEYNQGAEGVPEMSQAEAVLYGGLHRAAWAAAVGWVLLACYWGYGGPVNWILSHPMWQPLSRMTYTVYLTSLPIQLIMFTSIKRTTYYTNFIKVQETCGVMLVVLGVSLFVTLVSESPVKSLEKLIFFPPSDQRRPSPEFRLSDQASGTGQAEASHSTFQAKGETQTHNRPGDCSGKEVKSSAASSGSE